MTELSPREEFESSVRAAQSRVAERIGDEGTAGIKAGVNETTDYFSALRNRIEGLTLGDVIRVLQNAQRAGITPEDMIGHSMITRGIFMERGYPVGLGTASDQVLRRLLSEN